MENQMVKKTSNYKTDGNLILFYKGVFSQWFPSNFVIDGIQFKNAEMYMMWSKNRFFNGPFEQEILNASHPSECKSIGRKIPNFDPVIWNNLAKTFVYAGNMAKFSQNRDLLQVLFEVPGEFVECSPTDKIWGIGLDIEDDRVFDKMQWQGTNWLGEVITDVRDSLGELYYT